MDYSTFLLLAPPSGGSQHPEPIGLVKRAPHLEPFRFARGLP